MSTSDAAAEPNDALQPADDLRIRLRADASSRAAVLACYAGALVWLLLGSLFGDLASFKMHWPDMMSDSAWSTFGRVRTAHLNAVNYGWASLAMIGTAIWLLPR